MLSRTRIKICGIRTPEMALAAASTGADAIGLVFAASSPRHVTMDQAAAVVQVVPPFVQSVGLFVTPDAAEIQEAAWQLGLSMAQLHGQQDLSLIEKLYPLPILYAMHFNAQTAAEDLHRLDQMHKKAGNLAGILLDTPGEQQGGSGKSFDWAALRAVLDRVKIQLPLVLAGGLNAQNVAEAIRVVKPWAVDVSSGVESSRGVKDEGKMREFCAAVRGG
jgi:phosphoribosylanthranilate isomerase